MADKSQKVGQSADQSPPTAGGSGSGSGHTKKVYDRVLLWMLDIVDLSKDMKVSPIIEVGTINVKFTQIV